LDVTLYIQKVALSYQQYVFEKEFHDKLVRCVPLASEFYFQSAKVHFLACITHFENGVLKIVNLEQDSSNAKRKEQINTVHKHLQKVYSKTERFLYAQLSKKNAYKEEFKELLDLLGCYKFLLHFTMNEDYEENRMVLSIKMHAQTHHLRFFFGFQTVTYYNDLLNRYKKSIEKKHHLVDSDEWGNVCFTQALFFLNCSSILSYNNNTLGIDKLNEAMRIYQKTNNPRNHLCMQYFNRTSQDVQNVLKTNVIDFDIEKLLSSVPGLAGFANLGFQSVALYNSKPS